MGLRTKTGQRSFPLNRDSLLQGGFKEKTHTHTHTKHSDLLSQEFTLCRDPPHFQPQMLERERIFYLQILRDKNLYHLILITPFSVLGEIL